MNNTLDKLAMEEFLNWSEKRPDLKIAPVLYILDNNKEINKYDTLNRIRDYCGYDDLYPDSQIKPDYKKPIKGYYTGGW